MARNLSRLLLAAAVMVAVGCQTAPVSSGDPAAVEAGLSRNGLPQDGSWVRYLVNHESTSHKYRYRKAKFGGNTDTETVKHWSERITLSFLGRTVENGVPCCWVEVRTERLDEQTDEQADEHKTKTYTYKMLLKEKGLLSRKDPLAEANVVRGWRQSPDGSIEPLDEAPSYSELFSWTPGIVRRLKTTGATRDIDFASGRLSAATEYTGESKTNSHLALGVIRFHLEERNTVWLHSDLPIGFAGLRSEDNITTTFVTKPLRCREVADYILEDAGTAAQTGLPDYN